MDGWRRIKYLKYGNNNTEASAQSFFGEHKVVADVA